MWKEKGREGKGKEGAKGRGRREEGREGGKRYVGYVQSCFITSTTLTLIT